MIDINQTDNNGNTALSLAIEEDNLDYKIVEYLLSKGADPFIKVPDDGYGGAFKDKITIMNKLEGIIKYYKYALPYESAKAIRNRMKSFILRAEKIKTMMINSAVKK